MANTGNLSPREKYTLESGHSSSFFGNLLSLCSTSAEPVIGTASHAEESKMKRRLSNDSDGELVRSGANGAVDMSNSDASKQSIGSLVSSSAQQPSNNQANLDSLSNSSSRPSSLSFSSSSSSSSSSSQRLKEVPLTHFELEKAGQAQWHRLQSLPDNERALLLSSLLEMFEECTCAWSQDVARHRDQWRARDPSIDADYVRRLRENFALRPALLELAAMSQLIGETFVHIHGKEPFKTLKTRFVAAKYWIIQGLIEAALTDSLKPHKWDEYPGYRYNLRGALKGIIAWFLPAESAKHSADVNDGILTTIQTAAESAQQRLHALSIQGDRKENAVQAVIQVVQSLQVWPTYVRSGMLTLQKEANERIAKLESEDDANLSSQLIFTRLNELAEEVDRQAVFRRPGTEAFAAAQRRGELRPNQPSLAVEVCNTLLTMVQQLSRLAQRLPEVSPDGFDYFSLHALAEAVIPLLKEVCAFYEQHDDTCMRETYIDILLRLQWDLSLSTTEQRRAMHNIVCLAAHAWAADHEKEEDIQQDARVADQEYKVQIEKQKERPADELLSSVDSWLKLVEERLCYFQEGGLRYILGLQNVAHEMRVLPVDISLTALYMSVVDRQWKAFAAAAAAAENVYAEQLSELNERKAAVERCFAEMLMQVARHQYLQTHLQTRALVDAPVLNSILDDYQKAALKSADLAVRQAIFSMTREKEIHFLGVWGVKKDVRLGMKRVCQMAKEMVTELENEVKTPVTMDTFRETLKGVHAELEKTNWGRAPGVLREAAIRRGDLGKFPYEQRCSAVACQKLKVAFKRLDQVIRGHRAWLEKTAKEKSKDGHPWEDERQAEIELTNMVNYFEGLAGDVTYFVNMMEYKIMQSHIRGTLNQAALLTFLDGKAMYLASGHPSWISRDVKNGMECFDFLVEIAEEIRLAVAVDAQLENDEQLKVNEEVQKRIAEQRAAEVVRIQECQREREEKVAKRTQERRVERRGDFKARFPELFNR